MKVIYDMEDWKEDAVVATIGFFDGVHTGHVFLIQEMRKLAVERQLPSAVITFATHPRVVLQSCYQPKLLNSFDEKIELLSKTGVDYIVVIDFTTSLAALSAREFITDFLSEKLCVKTLFIGYDHRFGFKRTEGFEEYLIYGRECGMEVVKTPPFADNELVVSSSRVRHLIAKGDMAVVSHSLGYLYSLKGHVINGYKVGRTIGFPTANIVIDEKNKVLPLNGSYAVWIIIDGLRYKGMLYIGPRPTLDYDGLISIEINIFDFSEDIYNKSVIVEFVGFIREDMKFDSLDDLKEQMHEDKEKALLELKMHKLTIASVPKAIH